MNGMQVIGYTYEADCHCIGCAKARYDAGGFTIGTDGPEGSSLDENDIPYGAEDREGNPIHPIFPTDELQLDDEDQPMDCICGTCGGVILEA